MRSESRKFLTVEARMILLEEDQDQLEAELLAMRRGMRHLTGAIITLALVTILGIAAEVIVDIVLHNG